MSVEMPYVRPGWLMSRVVNPIVRRLGLVPILTVRGRRSGKLLAVPLGEPLELDGQRYLVSGRGATHWVRNLRAAGRATLTRRGRTEELRVTELSGADHARVIGAYRRKLGRAVDRYFAAIPNPADHPVFRLDPLGKG